MTTTDGTKPRSGRPPKGGGGDRAPFDAPRPRGKNSLNLVDFPTDQKPPEREKVAGPVQAMDTEAMLVWTLTRYQDAIEGGATGIAYNQALKGIADTHQALVVERQRKKAAGEAAMTEDEIVEGFRADWRSLPAQVRDRIRVVIEEED